MDQETREYLEGMERRINQRFEAIESKMNTRFEVMSRAIRQNHLELLDIIREERIIAGRP